MCGQLELEANLSQTDGMDGFHRAVPIFEVDRNLVECPQVFSHVRMSPLLVGGVENPDLLPLKCALKWTPHAPRG